MNQDFTDLLSTFNAHGVEYIVVGAHALAAHGHVRATRDLDGDRLQTKFGDQRTAVLSLHHLIANKKAAGRLQDLADVEALERLGTTKKEPAE